MRTPINELSDGQTLDQSFRVGDKQIRLNRDGGKYLLLRLTDATGTIVAMVWNAGEKLLDAFDTGDYVQLAGRTQIHKGSLQIIGKTVHRLTDADIDPADFDRFDAAASDADLDRVRTLLVGLSNVHLRRLGESFLADEDFITDLRTAAAAVNNHHAHPGGLLRHTADMMELAAAIAPRYDGVDPDLVVTGAFLHDIGKIHELGGDGELNYTDRGQLVGHIVIGVQMLGDKIATLPDFPPELRSHLEHLIVSHHGVLEYGSPKIPVTLEAVLLHHIDNLDSKMAACLSVIENDVAAAGPWTNYHPGIGRKMWKGR